MRFIFVAWLLAGSLIASAIADGIRIDEPQDGALVVDVAGDLYVEVELGETEFTASMRIELLLDGELATRPSPVAAFTLRDVASGPHVLQVRIVDRDGTIVTTSDPVSFEMHRRTDPD